MFSIFQFRLLAAFLKLRKSTVSFVTSVCLSVRPSMWNDSAFQSILQNFTSIFGQFFKTLQRKFKFHYNLTRIKSILHKYLCTCIVISRSVLLRIRNVSDKSCSKKKKRKNILSSITYFPPKSCKLWDNMVSQTGHIRQYNTAHALCMLDN